MRAWADVDKGLSRNRCRSTLKPSLVVTVCGEAKDGVERDCGAPDLDDSDFKESFLSATAGDSDDES